MVKVSAFGLEMREACVESFANKEGVKLLEDLLERVKVELKRKEEADKTRLFESGSYMPIRFTKERDSVVIYQNGKTVNLSVENVKELIDFLKGEKNA